MKNFNLALIITSILACSAVFATQKNHTHLVSAKKQTLISETLAEASPSPSLSSTPIEPSPSTSVTPSASPSTSPSPVEPPTCVQKYFDNFLGFFVCDTAKYTCLVAIDGNTVMQCFAK